MPKGRFRSPLSYRNRGNEKFLKLSIRDNAWKRAKGIKTCLSIQAKRIKSMMEGAPQEPQKRKYTKHTINNKWKELTRLDEEWKKTHRTL